MKVKVCGITNLDDALLSEQLGSDALGFIFYNKSKRFIEPGKAKKIIEQLSPFTLKVGVFVNEVPEIVNKVAAELKLNFVQLHGDEDEAYISKIIYPIIKCFRVNEEFNFSTLQKVNTSAFLLDTFSNKEYGGTGKSFNWKLIPENLKHKIILAGGVSSKNIETIFDMINPVAVDLSSALEKEPGKKDIQKLKEFFNQINFIRSRKCL